MRKLVIFVLVSSILLSLSACAVNAKPDTVVDSFCKAMQKLDFDGMSACTKAGVNAIEFPSDDSDVFTNQIIDYLSSAASKMTYSIEKSEIDGDIATVTVKYNYVDATPILSASLSEYFQQAFAMALSGASEDAMAQIFNTIFTEKIKSVSNGTSEVIVDYQCKKTEDGWRITNAPDDALNVITCNIYSTFDSMKSSFEDNLSGVGEDDVEEKEYVWRDIPIETEVDLATIKIRIIDVIESEELKGEYSSTTAPEGTKFVIFTAEIENITKSSISFNNDLPLYDGQERRYEPYSDAYWYIDNSFSYVDLAPNIRQTGTLIYNVPDDCVSYFLTVGKSGTNEGFRLLTN